MILATPSNNKSTEKTKKPKPNQTKQNSRLKDDFSLDVLANYTKCSYYVWRPRVMFFNLYLVVADYSETEGQTSHPHSAAKDGPVYLEC